MTTGLTADRLRQVLKYDPETGDFFWRVRPSNRVQIGQAAGRDHGNGYRRISVDGRPYFAHRLAWLYAHGVFPEAELDHVDGNRANNRLENLRPASHAQNGQNQPYLRSTNTSGRCGVSWSKTHGRWVACIHRGGRKVHLGLFDDKDQAAKEYLTAKLTQHPFQPKPRGGPNA